MASASTACFCCHAPTEACRMKGDATTGGQSQPCLSFTQFRGTTDESDICDLPLRAPTVSRLDEKSNKQLCTRFQQVEIVDRGDGIELTPESFNLPSLHDTANGPNSNPFEIVHRKGPTATSVNRQSRALPYRRFTPMREPDAMATAKFYEGMALFRKQCAQLYEQDLPKRSENTSSGSSSSTASESSSSPSPSHAFEFGVYNHLTDPLLKARRALGIDARGASPSVRNCEFTFKLPAATGHPRNPSSSSSSVSAVNTAIQRLAAVEAKRNSLAVAIPWLRKPSEEIQAPSLTGVTARESVDGKGKKWMRGCLRGGGGGSTGGSWTGFESMEDESEAVPASVVTKTFSYRQTFRVTFDTRVQCEVHETKGGAGGV